MRILIALPLLALAACQVSKEDNGAMTVQYNADVAENAVEDVGNQAENIAGHISNDVSETAGRIENEVDERDAPADNGAEANSN